MDVEVVSHFSMRTFAIGMVALVVMLAMLFTLPEYVGLELTLTMMATLGVLLGMYVILITEVIHRTAIALFGALVMLIVLFMTGVLDPHDSVDFVIGAIDFNTIGLLLGMMVIVGILGETGIFQYIGIKAAKISNGNVWKLMVLLAIITAVGSAFLDNVTMVLLMVPVTISVCKILNINPISFILAQIFASNIGGATTLIGDPPNIMIGSAAGIDFMTFAYHMTPEIIITMAVTIVLFKFMFRKDLKQKAENIEKLQALDEKKEIKDTMLLKKSAIILNNQTLKNILDIVFSIYTPESDMIITENNQSVFLTDYNNNSIIKIDVNSEMAISGEIEIGSHPVALDLNSDNRIHKNSYFFI